MAAGDTGRRYHRRHKGRYRNAGRQQHEDLYGTEPLVYAGRSRWLAEASDARAAAEGLRYGGSTGMEATGRTERSRVPGEPLCFLV